MFLFSFPLELNRTGDFVIVLYTFSGHNGWGLIRKQSSVVARPKVLTAVVEVVVHLWSVTRRRWNYVDNKMLVCMQKLVLLTSITLRKIKIQKGVMLVSYVSIISQHLFWLQATLEVHSLKFSGVTCLEDFQWGCANHFKLTYESQYLWRACIRCQKQSTLLSKPVSASHMSSRSWSRWSIPHSSQH